MAIIGSARSDERGTYSGGAAGDQRQISTPDMKGEVSKQPFYVHQKGWIVLRPKNQVHAQMIAEAMSWACDNPNIGYSQSARGEIWSAGTGAGRRVNCDCSSLVRQCVKEGTGKDPGNFTTANEVSKLMATGLFECMNYTGGMALYTGDILVTKTKGHTVIVTEGDRKSLDTIVAEVLKGLWGNGAERKQRLTEAGYDYVKVQAAINAKLQTPAEHIGQKGIDLIKKYEKCKLKAYINKNEKYYTIGWGHSGPDVTPNMTISQERADEILRLDLIEFERYVKTYVKDIVLTQNRMDALVSYCYNRGPKGMKQLAEASHTVAEYSQNIVILWGSNQAYKDALIKRRKEEQALFNS